MAAVRGRKGGAQRIFSDILSLHIIHQDPGIMLKYKQYLLIMSFYYPINQRPIASKMIYPGNDFKTKLQFSNLSNFNC